ncbi:hypothetical protein BXU06_06925 [Aquaspirillum sp. LM1]|nr:hypothetical protein BXU06_06925 [Aquaspirillum sp. LM1]
MPPHPPPELSSPQVQAIPIADCGELLIDVTHSGLITCGPPPECPETAPFYRLLRSGVVARLEQAQQYLPAGLRLRVYEGYRHPKIQQMLFDAQWRRMQIAHPTQSAAWCYVQAAQLASPLRTFAGEPMIPPHSTGGAVDIDIIDAAGQSLDFGMALSDWGEIPPELCATQYAGLTDAAASNRRLLLEVMTAAGLVNYPREWWHFSYGDRYWACVTGSAQARYGAVEELIFDAE